MLVVILIFSQQEMAFKVCEGNGHWFVHPESKRLWTNYSLCSGNNQDNKVREVDIEPAILEEEIIWAMNELPNKTPGVDTIPAELLRPVGIESSKMSLSCPRVSLHKNLFFSFICECVISLTTLAGIVQQQPLVTTSP
ncbi:CALCRL: Calcitonin receptor like receptor, partial [Crotalus adamanteus]